MAGKNKNLDFTLKNLDPKSDLKSGFTLIEMVVGIGIAAIIMLGFIGAYGLLTKAIKAAREKTTVSSLALYYQEVVRNMPYSRVGTVNGNPSGTLPDFYNPITVNIQGIVYNIYYSVTYIDDPADGLAPADPNPADYKQVKMYVLNTSTNIRNTFVTNVSPQGLEGTINAGAISIAAINATGQPVPNAAIHIANTIISPNIILDRTADNSGRWIEVGLPNSVNGYNITVTKNGYSTDRTYPITAPNPNPVKPDVTVTTGTVSAVSFGIDLVSNLTIQTLNQVCNGINGVNVNVSGTKLIGTNPNILKFNNNYVSANGGLIPLNNIEWDTYTPALVAGQNYTIYGTSPVQQINIMPATSQTYSIILGPPTPNSLLVIVKDAATGNLLQGANVHLQRSGPPPPQDYYATTGGSVWYQGLWTGGSGQASFVDPTKYFADDGNIDVNSSPAGVRLRRISASYVSSGWLESSTFDTGTSSTTYTTLTWAPPSQDPATSLKFQVATNNDNLTWNYVGPDGTAATFFTAPGSSINTGNNNKRYVRYKAFLGTTDPTKTPVLTSLNVNYVSGCFTPGQSIFTGLASGNNYTLTVSLSGYQTATINSLNISGNQTIQVQLNR